MKVGGREDPVTILKYYFASDRSQSQESLLEDLKNKGLLKESLWPLLSEIQGVDQSFRSKIFDALMANRVPIAKLSFYRDDEKEFLNGHIRALLKEGKKDEIAKLLPVYAERHVGVNDKGLYNDLMKDPDLRIKLLQSTVELFQRFRMDINGYKHAEVFVKNELVTPDLLIACYAEYLLQRDGYLERGDANNNEGQMIHIEGCFRILQQGMLHGKEALNSKTALGIAVGKFSEVGGKRDYVGLVDPGDKLPTTSDVVTNYDIDVLNSILQVRRKGGEEMTTFERVIATIQECIEFIFGGGVRKEIADAVRNELGMQNKGAERGGRQ